MEKIRKPVFRILYKDRDITRDIADYVSFVKYTDNINGIMDEISIEIENRDGRWFSEWMPDNYDRIKLYIGYEGDELLFCGEFKLDEKHYRGFPEIITLKASSDIFSEKNLIKTKKSRVFENTSLEKVVSEVIRSAGLEPLISLKEDIPIKRVEQQNITDIKFLYELAKKYGAFVKVMEEKVVFSSWQYLIDTPAKYEIKKEELVSYDIQDSIHNLYSQAVAEYFDKEENKLKKYRFKDPYVKFGDVLKIEEKLENLQQAKEVAKEALRSNNLINLKLNIELIGNTDLVAGLTVIVKGFGNYDGKYFVQSATHEISNSGYKTKLELLQCWSY